MSWALFWMAVTVILFAVVAVVLHRMGRPLSAEEIAYYDDLWRQERELQISTRE